MNYLNEISLLIIGGVVTYFFDRKLTIRKEKRLKREKMENQRKDRPEFLITNMEDYFDHPGKYIDENTCDIEVYVAHIENVVIEDGVVSAEYNDRVSDKSSWVCRKYELKNIGKTVIYETSLISNFKRNTCIFDIKFVESMVVIGTLNYYILFDKRIAPNESITLKLCYDKDRIATGWISAIFDLGIRDDNGNYWMQSFFAPEDKLYESRKITHKEFTESVRPDIAIECFKKPYLW